MTQGCELLAVMPVYNEEASLRKVVPEWFDELGRATPRFVLLCIDDGSTDSSPQILRELTAHLGPRLELLRQPNRGHGQTCLRGYKTACERGVRYVFQLDSDGQCDPQYFSKLWASREIFDVIYGNRVVREDGWRRVLASLVLKMILLAFARACCADANTPYRLMQTGAISRLLPKFPPDFYLVNVALAALLKRQQGVKHGSIPIRFRKRYGGESSVPLASFATRAIEFIRQFRDLPR